MNEPLTDAERFPLLTEAGRRTLRRLQEHPHAPRWNYYCGERLSAAGLANVRAYAARLRSDRRGWRPGEPPSWLPAFVAFCRLDVPFHRRRTDWSDDFFRLPAIGRADLRREPWNFVPDSANLDDLVVYPTSGTTGERLVLPAHPEAPNRYLPLMEAALAAHGVKLEGGERVSIIHVCAQKQTYTLTSSISYLNGAGFAKVNLNPADWRDPDDRARFLDDCAAELYTGDPFAFSELAALPLRVRPKALISAAAALLPGLRRRLEVRFGCPVIDLYSLNEAGPVAFRRGDAHEVLPHDLFVEVLDAEGRPCPPGVRGEITLTGGANPFLPLLRYRTADFAVLDLSGQLPRLVGFEGRPPTVFRDTRGRRFNSIDASTVLRDLPLPCFRLHQAADGSLSFRARCDAATLEAAGEALRGLFGEWASLSLERLSDDAAWGGKAIQYTSDLSEGNS